MPTAPVAKTGKPGAGERHDLSARCKAHISTYRQYRSQNALIAAVTQQANFSVNAEAIPDEYTTSAHDAGHPEARLTAVHERRMYLAAALPGHRLRGEQRAHEAETRDYSHLPVSSVFHSRKGRRHPRQGLINRRSAEAIDERQRRTKDVRGQSEVRPYLRNQGEMHANRKGHTAAYLYVAIGV